jgi:hypothetical protein
MKVSPGHVAHPAPQPQVPCVNGNKRQVDFNVLEVDYAFRDAVDLACGP